ncbi:MAG: hypothetical protein HC880_11315 [Bacteroidia bacterium]|nr:hypothetical protein [Bacteroidia bacterium]
MLWEDPLRYILRFAAESQGGNRGIDLGSPGPGFGDTLLANPIPIGFIQGSGMASPLVGQSLSLEAIVTGDFQGEDQLRGFFVQEEVSDQDNDSLSSEAIFIYEGAGSLADVQVGDRVWLSGQVAEYYRLTEITSVSELEIISRNNPLPPPEVLYLPFPEPNYLERYEGMRISFPQTLFASDLFELGRYGTILLSSHDVLSIPTQIAPPGDSARLIQALNLRDQILLDDDKFTQNAADLPYLINNPHIRREAASRA